MLAPLIEIPFPAFKRGLLFVCKHKVFSMEILKLFLAENSYSESFVLLNQRVGILTDLQVILIEQVSKFSSHLFLSL